MPGPSLPKPLAGLLGRIASRGGGLGGAEGQAPTGTKTGMKGEGLAAEGELTPGAELGPEGLLAAKLGYGGKDRRTQLRNLTEKANVDRFLAEADGEGPELARQLFGGEAPREGPREGPAPRDAKEGPDAEARLREGGEPGAEKAAKEEGREELVRGEQRTEAATEKGESKEARAEEERGRGEGEGGGSREEADDEEERPGWGWLAEEAEERERRRRFHLEGADPMGAATRCRGHLDDGSPCLRKPMSGTSFCREHRYT